MSSFFNYVEAEVTIIFTNFVMFYFESVSSLYLSRKLTNELDINKMKMILQTTGRESICFSAFFIRLNEF